MAVGWIQDIWNNTGNNWSLQSIDDQHNGKLKPDAGGSFDLDDKRFHVLALNMHYHADWCGIPWYYQGIHYKTVFESDPNKAVRFYQSFEDGKNWIHFFNPQNGLTIGRQTCPTNADYRANLRIQDEGIFVDIVNDDGSSLVIEAQIYDAVKYWVNVAVTVLGDAVKAITK